MYLPPNEEHVLAADVVRPEDVPGGEIPGQALGFRVRAYGMHDYADLFSPRQLTALTTLADLVAETRERVLHDALAAGKAEGAVLEAGGSGAAAYADAVATYLALGVGRLASTNSSLCRWNSAPSKESVTDTFGRQAIPMVWDYAEGNVWCKGPCELTWSYAWVTRVLDRLPQESRAQASQFDARESLIHDDNSLISTDPPYYDNIGYSDLSDFFYVLVASLG